MCSFLAQTAEINLSRIKNDGFSFRIKLLRALKRIIHLPGTNERCIVLGNLSPAEFSLLMASKYLAKKKPTKILISRTNGELN